MAPRRKKVSEKSLELNVGTELLQCIRSWPNCEGALWFGLTQTQEKNMGLDEFVLNVPPQLLLMLQFKSPRPASFRGAPYKFDINLGQYKSLLRLASRFPRNVHYVFPLYREWAKARQDAPSLAKDTWLMPVSSMIPLLGSSPPSSSNSSRIAEVVVERRPANITVRHGSAEVIDGAVSAQQYCRQGQPTVIPRPALEDWAESLSQLAEPNEGSSRRAAQGLCAVFVP